MWREYPGPIAAAMIACSTVALVAATPAADCIEAAASRQRLRVRFEPATTDAVAVAVFRREVDAIWSRYEVDVVWERPDEADPLAPPDLWVEVVDRPSTDTRREGSIAIAWLTFVNGVPARRIHVSKRAADALLVTASMVSDRRSLRAGPARLRSDALGRIMGRAVAHELGHYLLGSPRHADRGLMRAVILPEHLVTPGMSFLTLGETDVQALRAGRVARCEQAR